MALFEDVNCPLNIMNKSKMILYISSACPCGNGKEKMCKEYRFTLVGMPNYDFVIILVVWGVGCMPKFDAL